MNPPEAPDFERRILILAPTARDAEMTRRVLAGTGIAGFVCRDLEEACREMARGAGAALLTQEAILADRGGALARALAEQPPWSDFPLVVLKPAGIDSPWADRALEAIGHMTLLKRPVEIATLVSMIRAALRDRERQYAARDHFAEREERAEAMRAGERRLRFALDVGKLGSWQLDLPGRVLACSATCKANYGRAADAPFTYDDLLATIHPDDRDRVAALVERAVAGRGDFEAEYRVRWPDGAEHWVLVRGRAEYGADGRPIRMSGLSLNITERKRMEGELRLQAERLQEADRRKDEFLAMLAHELRNPLAAVHNAVAVLKASDADDDRTWAGDVIGRRVEQLARLIDDLLDVSRITRGKIRLQKRRIDAGPVLDHAVESARPLIDGKEHRLRVEIDRGNLPLVADPTRLEQVVVNLLNNAAKYTEPGGQVALTARREGGHVVIAVRDNGMGIAPDKLPEMFQLFSQGERSIARSEGGLGIGLTLVRSLAEMHGGSVTATSDGPGQGCEFRVVLPAAAAPPAGPTALPAAPAPRRAGSARILVVDDNEDTARGMARLLKLAGNDVRLAHDGPAALEAGRDFRPAFVLLDIGLPGMDGYEVVARLKDDECCREAVVIAVSGYGQDDDFRRSRAAGFDHHLVKPVDFDALFRLMAQGR